MKDLAVRFKAFVLDWDGTLIHSLPLKIENAARLFRDRYGADFEAVKQSYARHSGIPRRHLFDRIASDCIGRTLTDDEFPALSEAFSRGNREIIRAKGKLRTGTLAALKSLHESGCLLFVSTSAAQEEMQPLAQSFGIADYTLELLGSRPGFSKGPEHVSYIQQKYSLMSRVMAMVGDDRSDLVLARQAGIFAIGITGTEDRDTLSEAGADLVVDALTELLDYVG